MRARGHSWCPLPDERVGVPRRGWGLCIADHLARIVESEGMAGRPSESSQVIHRTSLPQIGMRLVACACAGGVTNDMAGIIEVCPVGEGAHMGDSVQTWNASILQLLQRRTCLR